MTVFKPIGLLAIGGLLVSPPQAQAQELFKLDSAHCCAAQAGDLPAEAFIFESTDAAEELLRDVLSRVGLPLRAVKIMASDVENEIACVNPLLGDRIILYNEDFIRGLTDDSQSTWATRAIVAHELGHHLDDHLQSGDESRRRSNELVADTFSGHVLFGMGATREDVTRVFEQLTEGEHYPRSEARVAAAMNGWWRASEQTSYEEGGRGSTSDTAEILGDTGQRRQTELTTPSLSHLALLIGHNANAWHAGGGSPGTGMEFRLQGRLQRANPGTVRVSIYFTFADGRPLFANPAEAHYRTPANEVATGSRPFSFRGGELDLSAIALDPIPYYVLNLVSTSFQTNYGLMARAVIFVDGVWVGETVPMPFFVNW